MKSYENTRRLVAFDVTEGMDRLIPQSFLGYMGAGDSGGTMGCSSPGVEGALWDVNDWRAEGSVVRAGEAWICAYFVIVGATEPNPRNKETGMTVAEVPVYCSKELFLYPLWG